MVEIFSRKWSYFQKLRSIGHPEGDVCPEQAWRAAVGGGQQGLHDVPEQAASGMLARQGKLTLRAAPRGDDIEQR